MVVNGERSLHQNGCYFLPFFLTKTKLNLLDTNIPSHIYSPSRTVSCNPPCFLVRPICSKLQHHSKMHSTHNARMTGKGDAKEISHFQDEPMKGALILTHTFRWRDGGGGRWARKCVNSGGAKCISQIFRNRSASPLYLMRFARKEGGLGCCCICIASWRQVCLPAGY